MSETVDRVVRDFTDEEDNDRVYRVGDFYPKGDKKPTEERRKSLLDGSNKNGKVYTEKIPKTLEDLTIPQLKERLDEKGIGYKASDNKADLIKLLEK